MVQPPPGLPLRLESGLGFDHGGEPVGGVVCSGSVGEVDQGAGREAVAAVGRAPERQHGGETGGGAAGICRKRRLSSPDVETSGKLFIKEDFVENLRLPLR